MKLKENALDLANNYILEKSTIEFIKDNIWVELDFKWHSWESAHLANPNNPNIVHLIPYGLLVWYEEIQPVESEEDEDEIIWPFDEDYNYSDNPYDIKTNEKFYTFVSKYKSHLILLCFILLFICIWINYNYQVKQKQIENQKQELLIKDKYQVLTDLDNDLNLKIDEELKNQEQIKKNQEQLKKDLANSYQKVKNLKAQKDQNFNNKLKLTN